MGFCNRKKSDTEVSRTIFPCTNLPDFSKNPNSKFASNYLKTTKYTLLTFLPLNLWEQLHRIANCYFIFILFLNFMPNVNAFAKELAILPVALVLAFTAIKDGLEDLKRYRVDKRVNDSLASVFSIENCCYENKRLADICPGDFIKLHANEVIPADILLLVSSEISGICHIETANLDGETNLKQRECVHLSEVKTFSPEEFLWPVEVEAPNCELYQFTGRILTPTPTIIRKDNLLLRGCILRNTESVEGMVIYAGRETKATLNNSVHNFKRSKLEGRLNRDIIWCIPILIVLCTVATLGTYVWLKSLPSVDVPFIQANYSENSALRAFENFWVFVIVFQAMIPLPLYITIETVKLFQVFFIQHDVGLYDIKRDKRTEVHAFNITEDLGQIEYVFCDKTGTLTENKMVFKRAVINGIDYCVDDDMPVEVMDGKASHDVSDQVLSAVRQFIPFVSPLPSASAKAKIDKKKSHSTPILACTPILEKQNKSSGLPMPLLADTDGNECEQLNRQRVQDFFLCLAICNTCVVSANKQMSTPFVPVPKRKRFQYLSRSLKSNVSEYSTRFRRLFGRRSQGQIFELDDTKKNSSASEDAKSVDLTTRKHLFFWHHWKSDSGIWEKDTVAEQPIENLLPQKDEEQGDLNIETESTIFDRSTPVASDSVCELQSRPSIQPKPRPIATKQILTSGHNNKDLLSRRRTDDSSLIDQSSTHICPLSEDTLLNGYESQSPDEVALVKTACKYGCKLLQRSTDFVIIWLPGDGLIRVELLALLPFDAKRKRMSILIRHPDTEEVVLYCKGADSAILPLLNPRLGQTFRCNTEDSLKTYSRAGLRTLVMAKRVISESVYKKWSAAWLAAEQDYRGSEEMKNALMKDIEVDLELLGATGIEDSLQEGVPETIAALRDAGIKVWVLTGDKQETAISIAYAAKLITEEQRIFVLSSTSLEGTKQQLESYLMELLPRQSRAHSTSSYLSPSTAPQVLESASSNWSTLPDAKKTEFQEDSLHVTIIPADALIDNEVALEIPQGGFVLVIDSVCMAFVQEDEVKELFSKLVLFCSSVICCRFTPIQKAEVTEFVKRQFRAQVLAVGDGVNDVNMIQCANVGVGISGQEGMQAAMASDFAITQFVFLKRLLLVHGHWCYEKLARMALYMFYKDAVYILSLFWFQFFNGFSGNTSMSELSQVLFNISFTSIPPFVLGAFDNILDDQTLLDTPKLYRNGRDSMTYKPWHFWLNTLDAVWQSLVIFFIPYLIFNDAVYSKDELGATCMNALVLISLLHIALETKSFTVIHITTYLGSYFVLWLLFTVIYNSVWAFHGGRDEGYFVIFVVMLDSRFWLCMVICPITALLPRLLLNSILNTFAPGLDTLAALLRRKHGSRVPLPIKQYVEEHDACQRRYRVPPRRGLNGGEPHNTRFHVMRWFASAGRLLQRMPAPRRHSEKPSVLVVRHSPSPKSIDPSLPYTDSAIFAPPTDNACYNSTVDSKWS